MCKRVIEYIKAFRSWVCACELVYICESLYVVLIHIVDSGYLLALPVVCRYRLGVGEKKKNINCCYLTLMFLFLICVDELSLIPNHNKLVSKLKIDLRMKVMYEVSRKLIWDAHANLDLVIETMVIFFNESLLWLRWNYYNRKRREDCLMKFESRWWFVENCLKFLFGNCFFDVGKMFFCFFLLEWKVFPIE